MVWAKHSGRLATVTIQDEFTNAGLTAAQRNYRRRRKYSSSTPWKEYRKRNPEKVMFHTAQSRAKKKGQEFAISVQDIVIPEKCPILQIPLFHGDGKIIDNSPSLDRIDNSIGYVPGNVRVISKKANTYKGDMTLDQVERLAAYMKGKL